MIRVTAGVVVEWALASHNRALFRDPAAPTDGGLLGRQRLLELALDFVAGLPAELVTAEQCSAYLSKLAGLGVGLRDGVFSSCGAETALTLMLCLLAVARFRPRQAPDLESLLARLETPEAAAAREAVRRALRDAYDDPPAVAKGAAL
jgi:hypothetical protein